MLLVVLQPLLPTVATSAARTISWSGYTWDVRPTGSGEPGPNQWSDSDANVHLDGSDLVLSVVKDGSGRWTSSEVDNRQHLGYGTYRWVVATDLGRLDANEVLGMFTYGGSSPSNNEIDLEPSHWGHLSWPTGSATVWQDADAGLSQSKSFHYTSRPPYVHQFTWMPGRVTFLVTDAAGATLSDWTVTSGVPTPSSEVPIVNYWRFDNAPPATVRSMRISSFTWAAPGQESAIPVVTAPVSPATAPVTDVCAIAAAGTAAAARARLRIDMRPRRFSVAGRHHSASVIWTATDDARLRLVVLRRVSAHFAALGAIERAVHRGTGRIRVASILGHHRLRPGRYRLVARLVTGAKGTTCAPQMLRFTVIARHP